MRRKNKLIFGTMIMVMACGLPGQAAYASSYGSEVYGSIIAPTQPEKPQQPAAPSGQLDKNQTRNPRTKSTANVQESNSVKTQAKGGSISFKLHKNKKMQIGANLFRQALAEKRDIEFQVVTEKGQAEYTIRMKYTDIIEAEIKEQEKIIFDLETMCKYRSQLESHYELDEAKIICMCDWPRLPGKAYVDVPVSWSDGTRVKEYWHRKDAKQLELMGTEIVVKNKMVTIDYTPGEDVVLCKSAVKEKKTVKNWVGAVKEDRIDKTQRNMVIFFAIVTLLAFVIVGGLSYKLYKDKKKQEKGDGNTNE